MNKYSKTVTQDPSQPAAQAMLHAIGLTDDDFQKPLVGIASTGYDGNPCNIHLNDLILAARCDLRFEKLQAYFYEPLSVGCIFYYIIFQIIFNV